MTDVPDYALPGGQAAKKVTSGDVPSTTQWQNPTQDELKVLRDNLIESVTQVIVQFVTGIFNPIDGNAGAQLAAWAENIDGDLISFLDALDGIDLSNPGSILTAIEAAFEALVQGIVDLLGPIPILGSAVRTLATFLGLIHNTAAVAQSNVDAVATTQSQQTIAKPNYLALDATADAVFPIAQISGSSPSQITIASGSSVIGFIDVPDNGKKSSIMWLGQTTTGLTGFYVNLYRLNTTTNVCTLVETSGNILSNVLNTLSWNYYDLVTPITTAVGEVYAVEFVPVGASGAYKIAGLPSDWKPVNVSAAYPQQLGSARSSSLVPAPSTFTPTYTGVVPWAGLGGFLFAGPLTTPLNAGAGTYTYTLPNWLKYGDKVDVIACGAGGGGQASLNFQIGGGGVCGLWTTITLIVGIDIPPGTTTLQAVIGAGGAGASGGVGAPGFRGGDTVITGTGVVTITCKGGDGGSAATYASTGGTSNGTGNGNVTFNTVTYPGSGIAGGGTAGHFPGGGGGGAPSFGAGQSGADGEVYFVAYQAGTTP